MSKLGDKLTQWAAEIKVDIDKHAQDIDKIITDYAGRPMPYEINRAYHALHRKIYDKDTVRGRLLMFVRENDQ